MPRLETSAAASASSEADGVWDIEREPPGLISDSCSYYSQAQLSRLIRSTWAAQTQPLNSFVCGTWPSLKKALVGQYAGMPLDPSTGKPYSFFGMRAPLSAFRVYGDDCYFYAVHVHEGAIVATLMALVAAVPMMVNLLHEQTRRDVIFYSQTSLFAGCPLSWIHVLCDGLYTLLATAYCVRWQRQLLVNEANPERAVQSASEVRDKQLDRGHKQRRQATPSHTTRPVSRRPHNIRRRACRSLAGGGGVLSRRHGPRGAGLERRRGSTRPCRHGARGGFATDRHDASPRVYEVPPPAQAPESSRTQAALARRAGARDCP